MVASYQPSVVRSFSLVPYILRLLSVVFRELSLIFAILVIDCLLTTELGYARDFGTHGVISPIKEEDPIILIQQKLKRMEDSGELERYQKDLQKKTKTTIERPEPVKGITKAKKSRVLYYDPTYVVAEDLKDHTGRIFYKKGTKINPLETVSLSQDLLFFDGDDPDQKAWVVNKIRKGNLKVILIKGAPLALSQELNMPIYFDQGGLLTKKLSVQHVPALVTQEKLRLRIEEIALKGEH